MRSVELFAGAGGLALGLARAGFNHEAIVEWDKDACGTLRLNQQRGIAYVRDWQIWEGDVNRFPFGSIEPDVDLLSGGVPCQPFSLGGKHKGDEDPRNMFPSFIDATRQLRPRAFLIENVKGLLRQSFSEYLHYLILWLEHPELLPVESEDWRGHAKRLAGEVPYYDGLTYSVHKALLNAADYGVPQRRERMFIIGFRSDITCAWKFPAPSHSAGSLAYQQRVGGGYWARHGMQPGGQTSSPVGVPLIPPAEGPWQTVRDAITTLPAFGTELAEAVGHRFMPGARSYPGHTGSPLDLPAKTLKAGDHGVPGGENMVLNPDGSVRYFSVREAARLQTFPDEFEFSGSWTEAMRQIGNAVPVDLAHVLGLGLRAVFAEDAMGRIGDEQGVESAAV